MGINTPDSGDTVTKSSITNMHESVRTKINSLDENHIGESSFSFENMQSTGSPLSGYEAVNLDGSAPIVVTHFGTTDVGTVANIGSWQELTAYRLDNSGAGFTTTSASQYVVYFTTRLMRARDNDTPPVDIASDPKVHAFFGMTYRDNTGTIVAIPTSVMGYGLYGTNPGVTDYVKQEIPVSIWCSFNLPTGQIIDSIRIYAALIKGAAAGTIPHDIVLERGTSGCLVFERI